VAEALSRELRAGIPTVSQLPAQAGERRQSPLPSAENQRRASASSRCAGDNETRGDAPNHRRRSTRGSGRAGSGGSGRDSALGVEAACVEYSWVYVNSLVLRSTHMPSIAALLDGSLVVCSPPAHPPAHSADTGTDATNTHTPTGSQVWGWIRSRG
jgi:hypothetical protein